MKPVHVTERDYGFDPNRAYVQIVKSKQSVFVFPDGVRLLNSELKTGINQHSKKRWWRWDLNRTCGVRTSSTGLLVPYGRAGNGQHRRYSPELAFAPMLRAWTPAESAYLEALSARFSVQSLADIYPMAGHFGTALYGHIPSGLHMAMRQTSGPDFARLAFGKSLYRRDLVKAACSADIRAVAIARDFRGLVPTDWIIGWLRGVDTPRYHTGEGTRSLRMALRQLDPRSLRHLLNDRTSIANTVRWTRDILRMNQGQPLYVRSYEQWHDELAGGWRRRPIQLDQEIPQTKLAERLHGLQIGDMTVSTAQTTDEMSAWGQVMHNCIGSYGMTAVSGQGVYAAVHRADTMVANLEVRAGRLVQLLGRFNQRLDDDTRAAIEDGLESAGVDASGGYWGSAAA